MTTNQESCWSSAWGSTVKAFKLKIYKNDVLLLVCPNIPIYLTMKGMGAIWLDKILFWFFFL